MKEQSNSPVIFVAALVISIIGMLYFSVNTQLVFYTPFWFTLLLFGLFFIEIGRGEFKYVAKTVLSITGISIVLSALILLVYLAFVNNPYGNVVALAGVIGCLDCILWIIGIILVNSKLKPIREKQKKDTEEKEFKENWPKLEYALALLKDCYTSKSVTFKTLDEEGTWTVELLVRKGYLTHVKHFHDYHVLMVSTKNADKLFEKAEIKRFEDFLKENILERLFK